MDGPIVCAFSTTDVQNREASNIVHTVMDNTYIFTDVVDNAQLTRVKCLVLNHVVACQPKTLAVATLTPGTFCWQAVESCFHRFKAPYQQLPGTDQAGWLGAESCRLLLVGCSHLRGNQKLKRKQWEPDPDDATLPSFSKVTCCFLLS